MPEMVTFSEMKTYIDSHTRESSALMESRVFDSQNFSRQPQNVFLSHSSKDKHLLPYVLQILVGHGGNPYVDVGDSRLPSPPSPVTAKVLKDAIVDCKRFVVFVTTNSKDSKWVPWELGIGDGAKSNFDIAIFPSAETAAETQWLEQEYLGLYRRVVWGKLKGFEKSVWMVWNHLENTATELSSWLKN